ncbi:hypothetical protein E1J53_0022965 [Lewinella sp. W8]|nr:hypothetical protein [Lewinella sp. W8]
MDKAALKSAIIEAYEAVEELEEKTKEELYQMAQDADIEGRSEMNKAELVEALEATED